MTPEQRKNDYQNLDKLSLWIENDVPADSRIVEAIKHTLGASYRLLQDPPEIEDALSKLGIVLAHMALILKARGYEPPELDEFH